MFYLDKEVCRDDELDYFFDHINICNHRFAFPFKRENQFKTSVWLMDNCVDTFANSSFDR